MGTVWKLKAFLTDNHITPNSLAEHVRGKLSKTAIYNLVQEEPPTSIHLTTLDILIPALAEMTGEPVSLLHLLEYRMPQPEWDAFSGIFASENGSGSGGD